MLYSSPRAAAYIAKYPETGRLDTTDGYWLTVLDHVLSWPQKEDTSCLFLASGGWPATSGIPQLQVYHSRPSVVT